MNIPSDIIAAVYIEQGTVCHYHLETINRDGTPYSGGRFLIVLNVNPKTDEILVLTTITKQIKNQTHYIKNIGEDPDTLVTISPSDFSPLSVESIVNCNNTYETTMDELKSKMKKGGKFFTAKLPKTIVSALVSGVLKSKQVPPERKKLIV
jgi:hypothetical protein